MWQIDLCQFACCPYMRTAQDMFPALASVNELIGSGRMSKRYRDIITEEFNVPGAFWPRMR
jgi:hypothetical protein